MKTIKKITLVCLLTVMVMVCLTACLPGMFGKKDPREPKDFRFEVTATSIKFSFSSAEFETMFVDGETLEYRIEDGEWQDSPLFEGLSPNTTYKMYVRVKEDKKYNAGPEHMQQVTTKKHAQGMPDVSYQQVEKTITVQADSALEYSFDEGATYSDANTHTYSENGEKKIYVRYKETDEKYSGMPQVIDVKITDYYSGMGTETDPYLIKTEEQFIAIKSESIKGLYFKLINDLNFESKEFQPVDTGRRSIFDGNNHTIENIKYENKEHTEDMGVFRRVGTVKNLTVKNIDFTYVSFKRTSADISVSLLAAGADKVENCNASGQLNIINNVIGSKFFIGGLVGGMWVNGSPARFSITDSVADVNIKFTSQDVSEVSVNAGGLLGEYINITDVRDTYVEISRSVAKVNMEMSGISRDFFAGGISGTNIFGKIENCYATGSIKSTNVSDYTDISIAGIAAQISTKDSLEYKRFGNADIESCYSNISMYAEVIKGDCTLSGISSLLQSKMESTSHYVKNCFFAGTMEISQEGTKQNLMDTVAVSDLINYTLQNCYHTAALTNPSINTDKSTAVSEEVMKTAAWQRDTLKFDPEIWNFTDGQYPTLK